MTDRLDLNDWRGKQVTLMGLGTFGGGVGAAQFLLRHGASVLVTDLRTKPELADSIAQLDSIPSTSLRFQLGRHDDADFRHCDVLVVTPAVPRNNRYVQLARNAGVPVTTEMSLFWHYNRGRIVGVTGSNGKSTTTAMIHEVLKAAGRRCWLGGNIGKSLLPEVERIQPEDWVVLELSSFQLADLDQHHLSPDIAVVTGFSPNHLDWHGTLDEYREAKQTILRWQTLSQVAILNGDDPDVARWAAAGIRYEAGTESRTRQGVWQEGERTIVRMGTATAELPLRDWLRVPGSHNLQNARMATCAAVAVGISPIDVRAGFQQFAGLPHRLEFVAEIAGRRFYNDSLATTPESVDVALAAFDRPIVLLAGGYDKKIDLSGLARSICQKAKAVALMGQTARKLAGLIEPMPRSPEFVFHIAESFDESLRWAADQSSCGDVILLSPGCASYDWFRNFQDRGDQFRQFASTRAFRLARRL